MRRPPHRAWVRCCAWAKWRGGPRGLRGVGWLLERQSRIENGLAQYGCSRDHRGDRSQIVYGLLCTRDGLPVAVEVFDGNTADPVTPSSQVETLKDRFGISRLVLASDRGMITSARIEADLKPAGLDWISCLRAPASRQPPASRSSDTIGPKS